MLKSISGILGAATLLLLLATAGSAFFPEQTPNWSVLLGAAIVCAILSVISFRLSQKQTV